MTNHNDLAMKVMNGTVRSDRENLCVSCLHSHITKGAGTGTTTTRCLRYAPFVMLEPIAECNEHRSRTQPNIVQMEAIAWQVNTDKGGKVLGFMSPTQTKEKGSRP